MATVMATRSAIAQLRNNLQDVEDGDKLIQNDFYLAVWLNLKHLNVRKAEGAIRDALAWHKARNTCSLMQETFPPALSNKLPIFLDGISKEGLPVGYARLTSLDLRGLLSEFETSYAVRYVLQEAIKGQRNVLEVNRLRHEKMGDEALQSARGFVAIIDAYGFTRKHVPPMKAVNLFIQTSRESINLASSARIAYVIGVSRLLVTLLKPLTPIFLSIGITLKVYGTDEKTWEPDLYQLIDERALQEFRERASRFEKANQIVES